jgi:hypothetical protein
MKAFYPILRISRSMLTKRFIYNISKYNKDNISRICTYTSNKVNGGNIK